jgi:phosphopantetheinyl transferase
LKTFILTAKNKASFNIAHHGSWVIMIGSLTDQVGCDLVDIPEIDDADQWLNDMMLQCLVTEERDLIRLWPESRHQIAQLMVFWALKESCMDPVVSVLYWLTDFFRSKGYRCRPSNGYEG